MSLDEIEAMFVGNKNRWVVRRQGWPVFGRAILVSENDSIAVLVEPKLYGIIICSCYSTPRALLVQTLKKLFFPYFIYEMIKGKSLSVLWSRHNFSVELYLKEKINF